MLNLKDSQGKYGCCCSLLPIYFSFPFLLPCQQATQAEKTCFISHSLLNLTEIADKSRPFCSLQVTVSSITSDGNRRGSRPRKSSASGRKKEDESKKPPVGNEAPNSSNQEDIIALFRRIQSSISKGETGSAKAKSLSSSKDKSTAESVLDVLRESRKNVRGIRSNKGGKASRWKSGVPKKIEGMGKKANAATQDFKLLRPPSNFVKRSPVPYPTAPRVKGLEQNNEVVATNEGLKLANIEKLKLTELKDLAKARGIKGYSRFKKSELVRLLRS
ncbi:hypothetical protein QUC31_012769 [Theobroma cacao]|uniref:Uncharacterized protein LOC18596657 isoform X1 n=1 Tax=Theobroma cacao TaxID=3641 RepID=A0AB32WHL9_THECC|nr:PREDICTED: uncharacterized protein LOC18596657 isoform X1 [Theobroma cacao]